MFYKCIHTLIKFQNQLYNTNAVSIICLIPGLLLITSEDLFFEEKNYSTIPVHIVVELILHPIVKKCFSFHCDQCPYSLHETLIFQEINSSIYVKRLSENVY